MAILVRPLREDEARTFFDIHSRAVRGLAADSYPAEVIEAWGARASDRAIERFFENPESEIRLLAELDGVPAGLGVLVPEKLELRACYVAPEAARQGVGSALVQEIERIARERCLTRLELHSSINAEPFYASLGYEIVERGEHVLRSGLRMAAVKMRKQLEIGRAHV